MVEWGLWPKIVESSAFGTTSMEAPAVSGEPMRATIESKVLPEGEFDGHCLPYGCVANMVRNRTWSGPGKKGYYLAHGVRF
jgi:hypothetical protein